VNIGDLDRADVTAIITHLVRLVSRKSGDDHVRENRKELAAAIAFELCEAFEPDAAEIGRAARESAQAMGCPQ